MAWKFKTISSNPFWTTALMLSPLFVLGFANIHRQMVAIVLWIVISRWNGKNGVLRSSLGGILCFFVHNSIILVVIVDVLAEFFAKKQFLKGFVVIAFMVFGLAIFGYDSYYFREGTDVGTSSLVYTAWFLALLISGFVGGADKKSIYIIIIGGVLAFLMFEISGGSSGSRMFIAFATIYSIDIQSQPDYSRAITRKNISKYSIMILMIAPTFVNDFARSLIFSVIN
jgi:hypothetical protein